MSYKTLLNPRLINAASRRINELNYSKTTGMGDLGSGAGQGGGDGGSIRSAGGSFGKREAAMEGEYFHKLQQKQLEDLKNQLGDELKFHKEQLKRHQEAIERINEKLKQN